MNIVCGTNLRPRLDRMRFCQNKIITGSRLVTFEWHVLTDMENTYLSYWSVRCIQVKCEMYTGEVWDVYRWSVRCIQVKCEMYTGCFWRAVPFFGRAFLPCVKLHECNRTHLYPKLKLYGHNGTVNVKEWELLHIYLLPNTYTNRRHL